MSILTHVISSTYRVFVQKCVLLHIGGESMHIPTMLLNKPKSNATRLADHTANPPSVGAPGYSSTCDRRAHRLQGHATNIALQVGRI
jgi:hypothetical protein